MEPILDRSLFYPPRPLRLRSRSGHILTTFAALVAVISIAIGTLHLLTLTDNPIPGIRDRAAAALPELSVPSFVDRSLAAASAQLSGIDAVADSVFRWLCPYLESCPDVPSLAPAAPAEPRAPVSAPAAAHATTTPAAPAYVPPPPQQTIVQRPVIERIIEREVAAPQDNAVSYAAFETRLQQLEQTFNARLAANAAQASATYVSAPVFAHSSRIDNLANVSISNPTITGGSVTASSITGTISNALDSLSGTIATLTGTELTYTRASFTEATSTTFYASNLTAPSATVGTITATSSATSTFAGGVSLLRLNATATSTLSGLVLDGSGMRFSTLDCSSYGNGGTLTTDASGHVVCAADDGGSGSTVAGSDTHVQFNNGGILGASSAFTFSSSSARLTVTNASTTNFTAGYASTSNLVASNSFTLGTLTGFLRATAGAVSTALVNLASDVTGVLPVANGGTGWANIAAGAIPYGNGSSAFATTTTGTNGYVLAYHNGVPTWTATTTFSGPLAYSGGTVSIPAATGSADGYLSSTDWTAFSNKIATSRTINTTYPLQGGGDLAADRTLSLAFGTTTSNTWGALQIFNAASSSQLSVLSNAYFGSAATSSFDSAGALTLATPLAPASGGTGISNPSAEGVLLGSYAGGSWQQVSTSSLGLLTTNVAEGSNLYFTTNRVASVITGTTTDALAEGSTNLYFTNARVGSYISGSSTVPHIGGSAFGDLPSWTGSAWTTRATSTLGVALSDTSGTLGATRGGTGLASLAANQLLIGSTGGTGWTQVATSSLGIDTDNLIEGASNLFFTNARARGALSGSSPLTYNSGTGAFGFDFSTANTWTGLNVFNQASSTRFSIFDRLYIGGTATTTILGSATSTFGAGIDTSYLNVTGTTATSTFANGIQLASGCFSINGTCIGGGSDSGIVGSGTQGQFPFYNAAGTTLSATSTLTLLQSGLLGIGTTSPIASLHIESSNPNLVLRGNTASDQTIQFGRSDNPTNWTLGRDNTNSTFRIQYAANSALGTLSDAAALVIDTSGNVGIGTTTPIATLSVGTGGDAPSGGLAASRAGYFTMNGQTDLLIRDSTNNIEGRYTAHPTGSASGGGTVIFGSITSHPITFYVGNAQKAELGTDGSLIPFADNSQTLGSSAKHWDCVYYDATNLGTCASDARLKSNIQDLTFDSATSSALQKLAGLRPRTFEFNSNPGVVNYGLVAQEVQDVAPELVATTTSGYLAVRYGYVSYLTMQALQELKLNLDAIVSAASTSTPEAISFAETFWNVLKTKLIAWFADAANGIGDFFASRIHTHELCVQDVCINRDQLAALLAAASNSSGSSTSSDPSSPDTTPPVISINGNNPSVLQIGGVYSDLGATATDNVDQNLGLKTYLDGALMSNIVLDTGAVGEYKIDYVATDNAGNAATSTRTVIVEDAAGHSDGGSAEQPETGFESADAPSVVPNDASPEATAPASPIEAASATL